MKNTGYIRGIDLEPSEVQRVKAAFIHRDTVEHPYTVLARSFLCMPANPPSDAQWIAARAFRFYRDGSVAGCLSVECCTPYMLHERSRARAFEVKP